MSIQVIYVHDLPPIPQTFSIFHMRVCDQNFRCVSDDFTEPMCLHLLALTDVCIV